MANFKNLRKVKTLPLVDAEIFYYENFIPQEEAQVIYSHLLKTLDWEQHQIKIFGRILPQPRLTALYAETEKPYTYSGLTLNPLKFPAELKDLQQKLERLTGEHFSHCLANLYRTGSDSMGLHSDDEKELGENPIIASISLGSLRKFRLKHKTDKNQKYELELSSGSLLLMQGSTQHFWKHEIPKTKKEVSPRINLTFRRIL
ncbi:alpha-ketoglutarate-dependent dioxygenase AlkB [Antarcticibacterium sp. 1MA-6-2]|uniref:alpha-ketoglutarate-dependent dioxygenase AlkB family protein n=1 Tax=Antarcticibacterium sp. 1MA-6-2 TaxID=2908210 RepID=UPI001F3BF578|nr:alpha-ketoglutarate-dependent dioxygenase AlkB [Antarcticibacterium sp. 1MA-6-2]UJH92405.1 alpha-ketoglutarate-dependent dioxygenase AlkB [Antarcticibacterium sp. 1MA-6-2]